MRYTALVEERLEQLCHIPDNERLRHTAEAAAYSLRAGGKRLRPELLLEICRMYGGNTDNALDIACAVEMIHTFSLIHDDLPCMDNDDMRRGKPSCHKAFGETAALLAGDWLAILPFEIIADSKFTAEQRIELVESLSNAVGLYGMIGGQNADTLSSLTDTDSLIQMYSMKTSALLRAACEMGCICADAPTEAAEKYAENLGIAFQIIDDILDVTADEKLLGKPVGSDEKNGKHTVCTTEGLCGAKRLAEEYTNKALAAARSMPDNEYLCELTKELLQRKY